MAAEAMENPYRWQVYLCSSSERGTFTTPRVVLEFVYRGGLCECPLLMVQGEHKEYWVRPKFIRLSTEGAKVAICDYVEDAKGKRNRTLICLFQADEVAKFQAAVEGVTNKSIQITFPFTKRWYKFGRKAEVAARRSASGKGARTYGKRSYKEIESPEKEKWAEVVAASRSTGSVEKKDVACLLGASPGREKATDEAHKSKETLNESPGLELEYLGAPLSPPRRPKQTPKILSEHKMHSTFTPVASRKLSEMTLSSSRRRGEFRRHFTPTNINYSSSSLSKRVKLKSWKPESNLRILKPVSNGGLKNFGNNCYVNSLLQVIASLKTFCMDLKKATPSKGKAVPSVDGKPKHTLGYWLLKVASHRFKALKGEAVGAIDAATHVKKIVARRTGLDYYNDGSQQDAHEFLQHVLDLLSTDYSAELIGKHFGSEVTVSIECDSCEYKNQFKDTYLDYSLHMPAGDAPSQFALQDLISSFLGSERMTFTCEKCSGKSCTQHKRVKGMLVNQLFLAKSVSTVYPQILVLSIKKFIAEFDPKRPQDLYMRKRRDLVDAPDVLKLDAEDYSMKGIILHHGKLCVMEDVSRDYRSVLREQSCEWPFYILCSRRCWELDDV